ncbi:MAG: glycoside hydrolase family 97 protein [Candidatus Cyclobacteriaceae bacterium M3_2C_046]
MKIFKAVIFFMLCLVNVKKVAQPIELTSPNKQITVTVKLGDQITYSISKNNRQVISESPISLKITNGKTIGANARLRKSTYRYVDQKITPLYGIEKVYRDHYNQVILDLYGDYQLTFRIFDHGVAYRFSTSEKGKIKVFWEEFNLSFPSDPLFLGITGKNFHNYEDTYDRMPLSALSATKLISLPMLAQLEDGTNIIISEADLSDYPGLYLQKNLVRGGLQSMFAHYPTREKIGGKRHFNLKVLNRANYIAETNGTRDFPWRVIGIADSDHELLDNHLTYLLAQPCKIKDTSWIKPGKVAWDWYNNLNLTGVDFKAGFNTETYKYFIDFAAQNNIQYVNLDEGWSNPFDLFDLTNDLDMMELVDYAKQKGVGLFLWVVWHVLDRQLEPALEQFEEWGISGLKIDFIERDDQKAVQFLERACREAAKRKILINYHGTFKPTGLYRTYPNLLNREAVLGLEYNKFSEALNPDHEVTIPFIRMFAGPLDFTPGAMNNSTNENFKVNFTNAMSKGTRAHQLGMYIVYFGPLQMLADSPTAYEKEPEIMKFLADVPTVWDQTVPLLGKVGKYVVVARRKGEDWFIGGMTGWAPKEITLSFEFLEKEKIYQAHILRDGDNADKNPEDYIKEIIQVDYTSTLDLEMMSGGGFALHLIPETAL